MIGQEPDDAYDWRDDAFKSWQLAVKEARLAGIREGRFEPLPDRQEEVDAARSVTRRDCDVTRFGQIAQ